MSEVIRGGGDLHQETASAINRSRTDGKTINFAIIYGIGPAKLGRDIGVSTKEAQNIIRKFLARWPGVAIVQDGLQETLDERGWIHTLRGRPVQPSSPHKALNYLIQGSAADLMKQALINVHGTLKHNEMESHIVCVIHDELILDCKWKEVLTLKDLVPELMSPEDVSAVVPITTDCAISSKTWADKKGFDESVGF